jgi:hypothetical protein
MVMSFDLSNPSNSRYGQKRQVDIIFPTFSARQGINHLVLNSFLVLYLKAITVTSYIAWE